MNFAMRLYTVCLALIVILFAVVRRLARRDEEGLRSQEADHFLVNGRVLWPLHWLLAKQRIAAWCCDVHFWLSSSQTWKESNRIRLIFSSNSKRLVLVVGHFVGQ
jgi:hypothetical protein